MSSTVKPDHGSADGQTAGAPQTQQDSGTKKMPRFTIARLRRDCLKLFGITVSTFDGATLDMTEEFTVEEMRSHIKKWLNKRVTTTPTKKEVHH